MSYEAVKWALYDSPMLYTDAGRPDTTARAILVAHCERVDKHGKGSYPGPAALIDATGYDERTIDRAERRLQAAGLLVSRGISHLGTAKWDVDMTKRRTDSAQGQSEARVARRRAQDAARQRSRRERMKAAQETDSSAAHIDVDAPSGVDVDTIVTDAESVTPDPADPTSIHDHPSVGGGVTDADDVTSRTLRPDVTDSASGCHGRSAPQTTHEPPMNHPGTIPGGTLPPDPLRTPTPPAPGTEPNSSPNHHAHLQPRPETATHDRTRAEIAVPRPTGCAKHGSAMKAGNRPDGKPACPLCRRGAPASTTAPPGPDDDSEHQAVVIPLYPRTA
ncbi:hypothetical protein ACFUYE_05275 [Micromonospora humida]|uniref:hypothetical protein n=1 Tax=Micromonospora humida TaxID=2809018 RepID=UPI00366C6798